MQFAQGVQKASALSPRSARLEPLSLPEYPLLKANRNAVVALQRNLQASTESRHARRCSLATDISGKARINLILHLLSGLRSQSYLALPNLATTPVP